MSAELVTVTIDGREISVPKGTLVIRAAEMLGIYVPRFCDHPLLDPLGACRQCLVEIEGQRKPLTACTTTVTDGMIVKTEFTSELAADAQKGVLELLLINHPLDCPMCDKGGECPLQDQALAYGPGGSRYIDPKRRFTKPVPINPLVRLDRERCVLCARCTRFADQISGAPFIELFERNALEQVAIFEDEPYDDVFSGNVTQICPVGALTSQTFRFLARPFDMTTTPSTCTRCSSGCAIDQQERRGQIARVLAKTNPDVNDEWLCDKGRFGYAYVASAQRVTEPLVRKGNDFVAVSWAEAVAEIAQHIEDARGEPSAVLTSGDLLDEDAYALSRFARVVLGTNDVDHRMRAGSDEEERILLAVQKSQTATYADIDAARTIVVAGFDPREESPIVYLRIRKAWRKRGARVIEVGPRRTSLRHAGAEWVSCAPGEEAAALSSLVLDEGPTVVLAGDRLATSSGALTAAWNLALSSGGRFGWVPRKGGARGAIAAGLHPALLPGARSTHWEKHRSEVQQVWGAAPPELAGRETRELLQRAGEYGVLWLAGADPARDFADATLGASALEAARFVVAQDMFLTDSAMRAHVVLPAAAAYERTGTITNWEGRAQQVAPVIPGAGVSLPDHEILAVVAEALDVAWPSTIAQLRTEMRALVPEPREPEQLPEQPAPKRRTGYTLFTFPLLIDAGTMMTGGSALMDTADEPFIEMNVEDAKKLGIGPGELVRVTSPRGQLVAIARPST
ncbi:MAG: NADH-quinone oxidoreductase subunit G, partial [Actinobacteria bacterium]|nr:NADH-quinone oxidoreductase subunit G [Actinomycetota bacterium]